MSTPQRRHGLVLACDLGRLLNQFGWHLSQAAIGNSRDHHSQAIVVLEQIEVTLVEFAPAQRGGRARHCFGSGWSGRPTHL